MKRHFLQVAFISIATICSYAAKAQTSNILIGGINANSIFIGKTQTSTLPKAQLIDTQKDCNVYQLPQDNMKCITPANTNFDSINAWGKMNAYTMKDNMPNATPVYDMIPNNAGNTMLLYKP